MLNINKRATGSWLPVGVICTKPNERKHQILIFYEDYSMSDFFFVETGHNTCSAVISIAH